MRLRGGGQAERRGGCIGIGKQGQGRRERVDDSTVERYRATKPRKFNQNIRQLLKLQSILQVPCQTHVIPRCRGNDRSARREVQKLWERFGLIPLEGRDARRHDVDMYSWGRKLTSSLHACFSLSIKLAKTTPKHRFSCISLFLAYLFLANCPRRRKREAPKLPMASVSHVARSAAELVRIWLMVCMH